MKQKESTPVVEAPVRFFRVPEQVIKAWERGEYFMGGVPSIAYKYLGAALRLRGLYTYIEDKDSSVTSIVYDFKGVAKIELVGERELVMEGIRLWAGGQPDIKFWKTEFSHFLSEKKIIWTYQVFECNSDDHVLKWLKNKKLPEFKNTDSPDLGFSKTDWQNLQQYLLKKDFDDDFRTIETKCTDENLVTVMLHFDVPDKPGDIKAQYRQLRSTGQDISGNSRFTRIG